MSNLENRDNNSIKDHKNDPTKACLSYRVLNLEYVFSMQKDYQILELNKTKVVHFAAQNFHDTEAFIYREYTIAKDKLKFN